MKKALMLAAKDLRSDARSKEIVPAMAVFSLCLTFLFSMTLPPGAGDAPIPVPMAGAASVRELAGTYLWVSILFASMIGFGRTSASDSQGSRIEGLLLTPTDPVAIFFGRVLANFTFLCLLEAAVLPFFILFLEVRASLLWPQLIAVAFFANAGLAAAGSLFGAASQNARAKDLVLPLLSFPIMLPVVLGASRLTSQLMTYGAIGPERRWFILIGVFDIVLIAIGAVTYEFVVQE